MGATWAQDEAWELGGRWVWRPACRFLLEAVGGQGGVGQGRCGAQDSASCPAGTLRFRVMATWWRLVSGLVCLQGASAWAAWWALGQPQPA